MRTDRISSRPYTDIPHNITISIDPFLQTTILTLSPQNRIIPITYSDTWHTFYSMMQIRMGNAIKPGMVINRTDEFQSSKRADYHSNNNLNGSTDSSLLEGSD